MIIVDPVELGDVACTRASPKWVDDRTGTLVQVPANTLGVTYNPSDLGAAPYALVESASTNLLRYSEQLDNPVWGGSERVVQPNTATAPNGTVTADRVVATTAPGFHYIDQEVAGDYVDGDPYRFSVFVRAEAFNRVRLDLYYAIGGTGGFAASFNLATGTIDGGDAHIAATGAEIQARPNGWYRCSIAGVVSKAGEFPSKLLCRVVVLNLEGQGSYVGDSAPGVFLWGANLTAGLSVSSYISTAGSAVTRAADVIGAGAGMVYSNVPIVEPAYSAAATYAKDAVVYDPATKIVYWSMIDANKGNALSDPSKWNKRTAINRWAMLDDRNSTQTSNPEEIIAVFSARAITHGLFAGALDASEVRIAMTHPTRGLVYSEARNLVLPRSGSSFFGWCFNRLRLRKWFLTLKLPVFANALVTIAIRKPGGVPKCGMCMIGPAVDVGLSLMGLSTELKDYSTTTFFADGTSDTIPRGFSKKMSIDISIERDRVETIEDDLIGRRQKTLVWVGSVLRGDAILVGKFSSLRKVIETYPRSKMALQIDGVLSQ